MNPGEIWAGVVASYEDLANNWHHPDLNPQFWQSISPISFVKDISGPIQLQHGMADDEVPLLFSQKLDEAEENKLAEGVA